MRIGLYGGSFDPIHNGHLSIVRGALRSGAVDLVIVIPSVRNPFKRGKVLSAAPYRYYMVKETIEAEFASGSGDGKGGSKVIISDCEYYTDEISYTINTLRYLTVKERISTLLTANGVAADSASEDHTYFWLCGSDILPTFDKWYKAPEILSIVSLLVASRPGDGIDIDTEKSRLDKAFGFDVPLMKFEIDGVEAASSSIRVSGEYTDIPDAAREFIKEHALYSFADVWDAVSDEAANKFLEYAIALYPILRRKRLLHTLNTGMLSAHYALKHGADVDKALIAGALHDCAKELPEEDQRKMAQERSGDLFVDSKLLHSPAGATMAREKFGIEDEEILDAITYHTTGRGNMTMLDRIVYLSDKLEPSRTYTDLTEMRKVAEYDLDEACRMCLGAVVNKFKSQGRDQHPLTNEFAKQLGLL
ncbi:nicotinate-nucleotide adenylyltransferase [Ruminococcaceae bacterium KH2T8]|nr:nicotinate-nucleotide adenylyltransferase [Ruminococcaceae bacterium KH2T8]